MVVASVTVDTNVGVVTAMSGGNGDEIVSATVAHAVVACIAVVTVVGDASAVGVDVAVGDASDVVVNDTVDTVVGVVTTERLTAVQLPPQVIPPRWLIASPLQLLSLQLLSLTP